MNTFTGNLGLGGLGFRPAESLAGMTVNEKWHIDELIIRPPHSTGGHFSVGYKATNIVDGNVAFLKAIDFSSAQQEADPLSAVKFMLDAYKFERDLLLLCKDKHMDRISIPLDHGHVNLPISSVFAQVYFLVFPMASGDLRAILHKMDGIDLAWKFRYLHNAAVGIKQLHAASIAHQDIKPSNLLLFPDKSGRLADLGRSHAAGLSAPHQGVNIAGDTSYAPFELHFQVPLDEDTRRYGCDAYLLGSLMQFTLTGVTTTADIASRINTGAVPMPSTIAQTYGEVLPYLLQAYEQSMEAFDAAVNSWSLEKKTADLISSTCRELCHPDHTRRGDSLAGSSPRTRFSMEKYVTRFDHLSNRLSVMVRRGN